MSRYEDARADALETTLSDAEKALLDDLADGIVRRRLTPAAMFFLESMKPLGFIGSQAMIFFRPLIQIVWSDPQKYDQVQKLLERRESIELLLRRLEARA